MPFASVPTVLLIVVITIAAAILLAFLSSLLDPSQSDVTAEAVLYALPRRDCGACGYASCERLAAAVASGEAGVCACPAGGVKTARRLAKIMEKESFAYTRYTARTACTATCAKAGRLYEYSGLGSCAWQTYLPGGGAKSCKHACHGLGDCAKVCRVAAISTESGTAVIDENRCTACGLCVSKCPQKLLTILPYDHKEEIACPAPKKGK
jgi:Na+-translocating ferredoxin:NAD+ oxidoreductase RNF subunit RnfB